MNKFQALGLSEQVVARLDQLGFTEPTEVQSKTIGLLLEGRDVIASAQTGTGKTAAFGLPIVQNLVMEGQRRKIQALVLVPTRELAVQVKAEFERFGRAKKVRTGAFYGGTGYGAQIATIRGGIDVAVATPGRLNDLLMRDLIDLSAVRFLVLDEADRMLDMGFAPQVKKIIEHVSPKRQTMLFSATIDQRVQRIGNEMMSEPVIVRCKQEELEPQQIDQHTHKVEKDQKDALLLTVLKGCEEGTVLVFTRTRRTAGRVTKRLKAANVAAEEIHSDISQNKRETTIARYRAGRFNVLVATDIAARGLDIPAITHVINYDLPDCPSDYIHRIGRTGRAGRTGTAHSFVCAEQASVQRDIERLLGRQFDKDRTPGGSNPPRRSSSRNANGASHRSAAGRPAARRSERERSFR